MKLRSTEIFVLASLCACSIIIGGAQFTPKAFANTDNCEISSDIYGCTVTGNSEDTALTIKNRSTDLQATGVYGSGGAIGVRGDAGNAKSSTYGVFGQSPTLQGAGVYGINNGFAPQVYGAGVVGRMLNGYAGVGVMGQGSLEGVLGRGSKAVVGDTTEFGWAIWGIGVEPMSYAGMFHGKVAVFGDLYTSGVPTSGGAAVKIDHPLDPQNKYLSHATVESPDMMNIYNGNITTDNTGMAIVTMPDYFEALNQDYRYQLTVVGQFAQAMIASEIENNHFTIQTDKPNVKVSWQVTGIRHDAWANAHRVIVEEQKQEGEQGTYLYPTEQGLPESAGTFYPEKKLAFDRHGLSMGNGATPVPTPTIAPYPLP